MYMMAYALHLLRQMQYTQVRLMIHMIGYAVHLINASYPSGLLKYMVATAVHCITNTVQRVHQSEAPDVNDGICSTLYGKCSTPK